MTLDAKRLIIAALGLLFLLSLVVVQWEETTRRAADAGLVRGTITPPASSVQCVACHGETTPGIVNHWENSTHAPPRVSDVLNATRHRSRLSTVFPTTASE